MVAISALVHLSGHRVATPKARLAMSTVGFSITMLKFWNTLSVVPALIVVVQWIFAFEGYKRFGLSSIIPQRLLYLPLISSSIAALCAVQLKVTSKTATIIVAALQLWSMFGGAVMLASFPASVLSIITPQSDRDRLRQKVEEHLLRGGMTVERMMVHANGVVLDSTAVIRKASTSRWLFYSGGNGELLENSMAEVSMLASQLNANAILFNPRGVGHSTGYVSHVSDLVEDATAVALHYSAHYRIDPLQLLLFGHSIGGGIVAELASRHFTVSPVVIDRSFSKLSDAAAVFSPFSAGFTKFLFPYLVGDLDTMEGWSRLNHSRKMVIYSREDEVVSFSCASIARLSAFQSGGADCGKAIELHAHTAVSWHNSNLNGFHEKDALYESMQKLFPSQS